MVNEIWRDIKDYPNYMVSNLGRVKSVNYRRTGEEQILRQIKITNGYLQVGLYKNGNFKPHYVHRLVAEAFIPNPDNKSEIDHINANKTDNQVCNLQWCSHKENINNPLTIVKINKNAHLKNKFGIEHPKSKPIIQFSKDGEFIKKWNSGMDAQRELGLFCTSISACCKGKLKTAGGYIWRYYYKGIWLKSHIPMKDKLMIV